MARRRSKNTMRVYIDEKLSQELRAIILEEGMEILGDLAKKVADEAQLNAPIIDPAGINPYMPLRRGPNKRGGDPKSGPIKDKIFYQLSTKVPASYVVCSPAWYSHFVEFGTQPHEMPRASKQEAIKAGTGKLMAFPYNGRIITRKWVFHPGIKQWKPFLRPAGDKAEQFLREILNERYGV